MPKLLTIRQFAEELQITIPLARQRCNSKTFRDNKIARREGREWRSDWAKYRKIVWGVDEKSNKP